MTRKLLKSKCEYCKSTFTPVRKGHKFCKETCRKLSHKLEKSTVTRRVKNKRISEKLKKLANSAFGKYLASEIKRAGTVQVLTGHTHTSLQELADLRRRCTAASGYEDGIAVWSYELSHIKPVQADSEIGLLHPVNLVIATKEFNRKLGNKVPTNMKRGAAIAKTELIKKWKIDQEISIINLLKKARQFVGKDFDEWLKRYAVTTSQKTKLLQKLKKAGINVNSLKNLTFGELKTIDKDLESNGEETYFYSMNKSAKFKPQSMLEEMDRFGIEGEIKIALMRVFEEETSLEPSCLKFTGNDYQAYIRDLIEQAELLLHGYEFNETWNGRMFKEWWALTTPRINSQHEEPDDSDVLL